MEKMYCNLLIAKETLVLITDKEEYSVSCVLLYLTSALLQYHKVFMMK